MYITIYIRYAYVRWSSSLPIDRGKWIPNSEKKMSDGQCPYSVTFPYTYLTKKIWFLL